ncbi:hypothetical protein [Terrimonas alba]|uniref:hypothetical protein n=1 Tax=Terrimonas alba TaxID=3349636 RepID=UPI0035F2F94D
MTMVTFRKLSSLVLRNSCSINVNEDKANGDIAGIRQLSYDSSKGAQGVGRSAMTAMSLLII